MTFDRDLDVREVAKNLADVPRICRLESLVDDKMFLTPIKHFYSGNTGRLVFDTERDTDRIMDNYKKHGMSFDAPCFKIACVD